MVAVTHIYQEHTGEPPARAIAAAALRAAADQVVPFEPLKGCDQDALQRDETRNQLLAIANELDPQ
jgi:hypothetical protein